LLRSSQSAGVWGCFESCDEAAVEEAIETASTIGSDVDSGQAFGAGRFPGDSMQQTNCGPFSEVGPVAWFLLIDLAIVVFFDKCLALPSCF
jgi:hypothetical protein